MVLAEQQEERCFVSAQSFFFSSSDLLNSAGVSPFCIQSRLSEGLQPVDLQDGLSSPTNTQFDFSPSSLDQRDEDQDDFRYLEFLSADCRSHGW